jgi:Na+-translocating ferredoxin:NAD+ oxidoreductase RnfD subunit
MPERLNVGSIHSSSYLNSIEFLHHLIALHRSVRPPYIIVTAFLVSLGDGEYLPVQNHLMLGATMLGAFFIATDPVSASTTPKGRLIYGFLIGVLIVKTSSKNPALNIGLLFICQTP